MESSKEESGNTVVAGVEEGSVQEIHPGLLHRKLKSRHIQFIAIGGTIGTGLFLGIGSALATAGPLSLFLGYLLTGVAVYAMVSQLGSFITSNIRGSSADPH
jgi:amino acid transporter